MKIQVRHSVFETNSSSTHSICITTAENYDKFKNGELYWYDEELYTREEIIEKFKLTDDLDIETNDESGTVDDKIEDLVNDHEIQTFDTLGGDEYETFTASCTTPNGEDIVAFGYHGYSG
jgi:cobalamin biosynthesis Co2+ chelatase CbiK